MLQQILSDIASAASLELLAQIWAFASSHFDPASTELAQIGSACQARDAELRSAPPPPPVVTTVQMPVVEPVSPTPPGWMKNASAVGLATREASGLGGLPALDILRSTLVDLSCAAWDCGLDLSHISKLKEIQAATHEDLWAIADQMLYHIREFAAQRKSRPAGK